MPKSDVLIIGSGSAGIFAGVWLAIHGIPFTILERRGGALEIGQADGVQCRTVEIYESFGVSEELIREGYHVREVAFWGPSSSSISSDNGQGKGMGEGIERKSRAPDTERGLSHCPHVILNQARMNAIMLGVMEREGKRHEGGGEVANGIDEERKGNGDIEYGVEVKGVEIDGARVGDPNAHCVKVVAEKEGKEVVWEAKYVLGCDGAHSTVRKSLSTRMLGDTTDTVWGVMDIYPLTTFPDIRRKCTLHSASGALLIIPREGGSLVRFYIQLPPGSTPAAVTLPDLLATAKRIFAPYELEVVHTAWWSAYSIGQRIAERFEEQGRVFLTGDACHTHSPKAGQGMNVSLQDGYNVGWKLGAVLSGVAKWEVLDTYVLERRKTAEELIAFDKRFASMFGKREGSGEEFARLFVESGRYTAGLMVRYGENRVTDVRGSAQGLAGGVVVGMRMPSAQVIRFCDYKEMQLAKAFASDGRWRVVVFGGDINADGSRVRVEKLAQSLERLARRFTPPPADVDSLIEPILVLKSKFADVEQEQIPDYFWPITGRWKIRDLHKVYIDDEHYNSGHGHAYEKFEINPTEGAVAIVRPDQYVAKVTTLDDSDGIASFFQGFLIEKPTKNGNMNGTGPNL
ncbi:phenol 2-monooxygenase-like protein [Lophiostoma macrostomum CBS 122681]|uniref:Phenol 2-monooxygenase-like protein n=1 Tax=Lophiostoma macrostomum CBS 122681 TaxID=1314788 RepID=A0A6A6SP24_9PLEO|nr:phenol 2-monooxygenase-like protein [Lophiostoma macrostomum CBS 122681]